jgi:hypothetical protein
MCYEVNRIWYLRSVTENVQVYLYMPAVKVIIRDFSTVWIVCYLRNTPTKEFLKYQLHTSNRYNWILIVRADEGMEARLSQKKNTMQRKALALLIPLSYSKAHESCAAEVSFPREFLHDIAGSLFTEPGRCRRACWRLQKGEAVGTGRSHYSRLQPYPPLPPPHTVPPSRCFSQHALSALRN